MTETPSELPDLLDGLNDRTPARKAFVAGALDMKYGALRERVARTRGLFRRLGLDIGDRVVIATADDLAAAGLYLACLLSGVTAVMIDPAATAAEATVLVERARAKLVVADRSLLDRATALRQADGPQLIAVDAVAAKTNAFGLLMARRQSKTPDGDRYPAMLDGEAPLWDRPEIPSDCVGLILFTSGTTSRPKGVALTHGNLAAQLKTFRRHYGYDDGCKIVNHLPLHHSDGLNQGVLLSVALGATWLRPPSVTMQTLGDMMDLTYRKGATHLVTVPTVLAMMRRLPANYDDSFASPEFRFAASTAGFLDETVWRDVEDRFGIMVVNSYGLTETVMEALYCGPTDATRRIGTIGKPVDCEARIVGAEGEVPPPGAPGELWLRGENIMAGYFDDPEATQAVLRDGWLMTGDLARQNDEGFFHIVGRKKSVIIRAGTNISPEEVNTALAALPGVDAATIGLPDELLGERVVCCVVAPEGALTDAAIMAHCRATLAAEKWPNEILRVPALPYGPSGKVELDKLRSLALQRDTATGSIAAADAALDEQVLAIAARVFQQPREALSAGSDQDSVKGWDSLSYLEMVSALERHFGLDFSPRDVMNIKQLGDAVRVVETRLAAAG